MPAEGVGQDVRAWPQGRVCPLVQLDGSCSLHPHTRFYDYKRQRYRGRAAERHVEYQFLHFGLQSIRSPKCPSSQCHYRYAASRPGDLDVGPADPVRYARAKGFDAGFLRSKLLSQEAGCKGRSTSFLLLRRREYAIQKALTLPLNCALDAINVAQVRADADDHGAVCQGLPAVWAARSADQTFNV